MYEDYARHTGPPTWEYEGMALKLLSTMVGMQEDN